MRYHERLSLAVVLSLGLLGGLAAVHADTAKPEAHSSAASQKAITQVTGIFSDLKVFPNPWRADKHPTPLVTFAPLPNGSTVKLFTTSGHWIKTLPAGGNTWDLTNDKGEKVASGVYLYNITATGTDDKAKGKIIVIK